LEASVSKRLAIFGLTFLLLGIATAVLYFVLEARNVVGQSSDIGGIVILGGGLALVVLGVVFLSDWYRDRRSENRKQRS
jgi:hypothetical protein